MNFKRIFIGGLIAVILLTTLYWVIFGAIINGAVKQVKKGYEGYDTSVVYHNGKWDTTITKKTAPGWLK